MSLIRCESLSLSYEGHSVVSNLNFSVEEGNYLCILGENGSGKTTLMKALLGLKAPAKGKILYDEGLTRKDIGYLPQRTAVSKDFPASVREIVLSGCAGHAGLRPFYTKEEKECAERNMERLSVRDLENRCFRELSGGQQQRVLLARALCAARRMLFLDEPAASLDSAVTKELYKVTETLNRDENMTVVMISHDLSSAMTCASHILHIGSFVFFGTREEYRRRLEETGEDSHV